MHISIIVGTICCLLGLAAGYWVAGGGHANSRSSRFAFIRSLPFLVAVIATLGFLSLTLVLEQLAASDEATADLFSMKTAISASKEAFFAAFIALFIIVTIEVVSRREQIAMVEEATEEIQESVYKAIFKRQLDERVLEAVESTIFRAPVIREYSERAIKIESVPDSPDHVLLKIRQKYSVRNIIGSSQPIQSPIYIPKPSNSIKANSRIVSFTPTAIEGVCTIPTEYPFLDNADGKAKIASLKKASADGNEEVYLFPAISLEPNALLQVELEMHLVKDISDNEIMTFLSPTLGGAVSVSTDIEGLRLNAVSLHRGSLKESVGNSEKSKTWTFNDPILPYQGYVVYWDRNDIGEQA